MPVEGIPVDIGHGDMPVGQIIGVGGDGVELFLGPGLNRPEGARGRVALEPFDGVLGSVQEIHAAALNGWPLPSAAG